MRSDRGKEDAMAEPVIAQIGPYEVAVEAGKKYLWCRCGHSAKQPFCDNAHKGTGMTPLLFTAQATETVYLCGCKRTTDAPYCSGAHETLSRS